MEGKQPESNPSKELGRGRYRKRHLFPSTQPPEMHDHVPKRSQWEDGRYYGLEIIQNPERGRTCGFGDKDRRPIAPALIAKLVATNADGSPVAPEKIDPSFFIVTVDLWSGNGKEERVRVLNNTPREKVQRDKRRQATHDNRPDSAPSSAASAPSQNNDPATYSGLFSPLETTSGLSGSGSSTLYAGSHYTSPIGASPVASSLQQNPIMSAPWGVTGSSHYTVPPLPPSNAAPLYSAQADPCTYTHSGNMATDPYSGMPPFTLGYAINSTASPPSNAPHVPIDPQFSIGVPQAMPTAHQPFPYGPTASAFQPGLSVQHSGQYAPINPNEVYQTLIGTSTSSGAHIKDDQDQINVLFVFGDLSVRTEGIFRLRLRLSNIGEYNPMDGRSWTTITGASPILAEEYTEPFEVFSPKYFPGVPAITELSKAVGIQGQKIPKRTKPTTNSGASRSKKRKQRDDEDSDEVDGEWSGEDFHDD